MDKKQLYDQFKTEIAESLAYNAEYTAEQMREIIESSGQRRSDEYDYEQDWFYNLSAEQQNQIINKRLEAFKRASKIINADDNNLEITILWPDLHEYEPYSYSVFDDFADLDVDTSYFETDYVSSESIDPFCSLETIVFKLTDDNDSEWNELDWDDEDWDDEDFNTPYDDPCDDDDDEDEIEESLVTEAKSDDGYEDYYEFDIQSAVDTLTDTGKWIHTSKNGGVAVVNPETGARDTVLAVDKDEDEEEPGYYVFYGNDSSSLMAKANEVAKRIKNKFGVDIIITPGDGMVEMEIPASVDIKMFQRQLDAEKGTKNGRKVKNKKVDVTDLDKVADDLFAESLTEEAEDTFNENNWLVRNTQLKWYADPNNRDEDFEIWPKGEWITSADWKKFLNETTSSYFFTFKEMIYSYIAESNDFDDDWNGFYDLTDEKLDQLIAENPNSELAQNVKRSATEDIDQNVKRRVTEDVEDTFNENNWLVRNVEAPDGDDAKIWPKGEWITAADWKEFLSKTKTPYYYSFVEIIISYTTTFDDLGSEDLGSDRDLFNDYRDVTDAKLDALIARHPDSEFAKHVKRA